MLNFYLSRYLSYFDTINYIVISVSYVKFMYASFPAYVRPGEQNNPLKYPFHAPYVRDPKELTYLDKNVRISQTGMVPEPVWGSETGDEINPEGAATIRLCADFQACTERRRAQERSGF